MDQAPFSGLQLSSDRQGYVAGGVGDEETCSLFKREVGWDGEKCLGIARQFFGVATLCRTEDTVADLVWRLGLGMDLRDNARKLFRAIAQNTHTKNRETHCWFFSTLSIVH
jgi:hypothetical protein